MTDNISVQNAYLAPVSFAQQRVWFLSQMLPGNASYIIANTIRITNTLDVAALQNSYNEIVRRHESLRITFASVDGVPMQVITGDVTFPMPLIDLTHVDSVEERWEQARQLANQEAASPFDLIRGPLIRLTLIRIDPQSHLLLLTMHHIISDGWSISVFMNELAALYEAFTQGKPSPLPDLPIQYADFAEWQREWLQGDNRTRLVEYWKRQLEGISSLELPLDHPRPAYPSYNGTLLSWHLPLSLVNGLKALSRQEEVTLFMTLLAAFQTLLARYSGQEDIAVGSPIANRTRTEVEGLIGFFANTLVLRTDLSGKPSFRHLLGRVREMLLDAYAHQDLPFELLVEELRVPRDTSRNPLFQVMFDLQNTPHATFHAPNLLFDPLHLDSKTARFDLVLFLEENDNGLNILAEYSTDLFEEETIQRLLGHYEQILQGVVQQPDLTVDAIPLLTAAEQQRLIVDWNQTAVSFPPTRCIHYLIEEQVARTPNAPALLAADQTLSYEQLNTHANQLAHHLQRLGVQPGNRVGVYLPRSVDALVALLATLKTGCAYVPIDPANPAERVAFMLQDAQVCALLTHADLRANLPTEQERVVCLDADCSQIATAPSHNLTQELRPDLLFYVMYTSGSTGRPKGVAMSHRALYNLLHWQLETMVPPRAARLLQYASLSFDVSFQEIFPTLSAGGSILVISETLRRDPVGLLRFISEHRAEKFYLPVVALQQLAAAAEVAEEADLDCMREITAAGEQLRITPQIVRFFHRASHCTLHNFYGPTETHGTTLFTLSGPPDSWPTLVPIGTPIANDQNYVLDARGQLQPIGIAGELYLGGAGLADGYYGRPDLTAERFVPDPFGQQPGGRLYRTGDLARWRADGLIEFLGRIDHQVKVRGFRVELEEIEAVLTAHPGVHECVVALREDVPGNKRLVAYLVSQPSKQPSVSQLRALVQQRLPEYMVPASYVFLEQLPLTLNRKVDRKRLPAPDEQRPELETQYVAPRTPTEETISQMWGELLKVERVGVQDNFFELGGHSLLVTQVISRLRSHFGVELPLRSFFEKSTISQIAEEIDQIHRSGVSAQAPVIKRGSRQRVNVQVSEQGELMVSQTQIDQQRGESYDR